MAQRPRKKSNQQGTPAAIADIVPHPRYGDKPVPSGCTATAEQVRASFYRYQNESIYPESAIAADLKRQNFTTFPRGYYVDTLKQCRGCERPFIFFAKEQQYWYETLGFHVDADCHRCVQCRRSERELHDSFRRYSESVGRTDLGEDELGTLTQDALSLWNAGVLRNEQQLRRIRNLAQQRIPDRAATKRIERAIADLQAGQPTKPEPTRKRDHE